MLFLAIGTAFIEQLTPLSTNCETLSAHLDTTPTLPFGECMIEGHDTTPGSCRLLLERSVFVCLCKMSRKGGEVVKEGFLTKSPPVEKPLAVS